MCPTHRALLRALRRHDSAGREGRAFVGSLVVPTPHWPSQPGAGAVCMLHT